MRLRVGCRTLRHRHATDPVQVRVIAISMPTARLTIQRRIDVAIAIVCHAVRVLSVAAGNCGSWLLWQAAANRGVATL